MSPLPTLYKKKNSRYWWVSRYTRDENNRPKRILKSTRKWGLLVLEYTLEEALKSEPISNAKPVGVNYLILVFRGTACIQLPGMWIA